MADAPLYDPAVHTAENPELVLLEMWCACGIGHRQLDPVAYLLPQIEGFRATHSGAGHGPTSAAEALTEREARREAGFRAAGRQDEYEPKDHPGGVSDGFDWAGEN